MQEKGIRPDQIAQVRGYADQKLRNVSDPGDPSNRRITLIIQSIPVAETPKVQAPKPARLRRRSRNKTLAICIGKYVVRSGVDSRIPLISALQNVHAFGADGKIRTAVRARHRPLFAQVPEDESDLVGRHAGHRLQFAR